MATQIMELRDLLEGATERLRKAASLRDGSIVFRFRDGDVHHFRVHRQSIEVVKGEPKDKPLIELIGEPDALTAILEGRKDVLSHFFKGHFRIRGNPKFYRALAMELGFIEKPVAKAEGRGL